jgi:plastocyanin
VRHPPVAASAAAALALSPLLLLAACGAGGPAQTPYPIDVAAVVEVTGTLAFAPDVVTVPAGTTVEWRNTTLLSQAVVADPAKAGDPADVALPEGAQPFASGDIPRGQVWRHTFAVPGTYRYVGLPRARGWLTRSGTVEVTPF